MYNAATVQLDPVIILVHNKISRIVNTGPRLSTGKVVSE